MVCNSDILAAKGFLIKKSRLRNKRDVIFKVMKHTILFVPGLPGTSLLVFNHDAKVSGGAESGPLRVEDGAFTAYLYPVATRPVAYQNQTTSRTLWVTRSWATADAVGDLRVMSYLLIFRPTGQPAPAVTDITLTAEGHGGVAWIVAWRGAWIGGER